MLDVVYQQFYGSRARGAQEQGAVVGKGAINNNNNNIIIIDSERASERASCLGKYARCRRDVCVRVFLFFVGEQSKVGAK